MMEELIGQTFDAERALYGRQGLTVTDCRFDGPADGESAIKECRDITVNHCYCNLRYPFWHTEKLTVTGCELTPNCRAALWYSKNVRITDTRLHGIKALRECADVSLIGCDIDSPEFGWSSIGVSMTDCTSVGEYFMLRAEKLAFDNVTLHGKYSFQYIRDAELTGCTLDTKDAFWHARNVTVRDSVIRGEYLGWYSENLTLERCHITGTQPLCYCRGLRLIDCEMTDADFCFERSEVDATLTAPVISIRQPRAGVVRVPAVDTLYCEDPEATGRVILTPAAAPPVDTRSV